jgi:hypothetical protein
VTHAVIRLEEVPAGTPFREWINISGDWLTLDPPGLGAFRLRPDGRLQIPCADLVRTFWLEPWLEGLELRGVLAAAAVNDLLPRHRGFDSLQ